MKKALGWSITVIGVMCLVFFFGMFMGRHTLNGPRNGAVSDTATLETSCSVSEKININTADASQLQNLPGIGETLAERIVAYRVANGPFTNILQLKLVDGIGDGKMAELIHLICVEDSE